MPPDRLPSPLIHTVADILSAHYYSHSKINALFVGCGADELSIGGSLLTRITTWLKESQQPFDLLGCVLENFMELNTQNADWLKGRERVTVTLAKYGLVYEQGGRIVGGATGAPSRSLDSMIRNRDLPAVQKELNRALDSVERDPPSAITAACSIIESLCKVYIADNNLTLPSDQSIKPLWRTVQNHLGIGPQSVQTDDMRQILGGLASIVNGVGDLRTHAGSAHGRGNQGVQLAPKHARLAVHAAHTIVGFILETWER